MMKYGVNILSILMIFILTGCSGGGGSSAGSGGSGTGNTVSLTGVVVSPNLGVVSSVTVTATDLITNKVLGSTNTQNADGTYIIPNAGVSNPIIIKVTGGSYLDEATGANKSLPASGISACIANPAVTTTVAVTTVTEIATQAALKAGTITAANIDAANRSVGSALLGGADPTTTIPVDISKAIPANATQAQKNYARLLAGLAVDAKNNSGGDLYTAAQKLTNALFDASGAPKLSTGGALPVEITNLQAAVQSYTAVGTISAANVPASDPYAVIGVVNPALAAASSLPEYYYMEVYLDPYTAGVGQISESIVEMGIEKLDVLNGQSTWQALYASSNGQPIANAGSNKGTNILRVSSNGSFEFNNPATPTNTPNKYKFSKDGQFAVGRNIGDTGAMAVRLNFFVKKPTVAPTLASVAGTYHIILMGHDASMSPTASAGYTEHGTYVLDGNGNTSYTGTNTDVSTGVVVTSPVTGTNTYTVDAYGVVLSTNGNGHILLSENGQYGLYEVHGGTTQEWGIVIKDHNVTVPFSKITTAKVYDTHAQGGFGTVGGFYKGLNVANFAPVSGSLTNMTTDVRKGFAPIQFAPKLICGTLASGPCYNSGLVGDKAYMPANVNDGANAVNGNFFLNPNGPISPLPLSAYTSQNGDVFWVDDGEAAAIVIGIGR